MRPRFTMQATFLRTRIPAAVAAAVTALAAPGVSIAQDYPSRPIRMIAPFVAGSGADAYARVLARKLSDILRRQVVMDNRAGAQGIIGTETQAGTGRFSGIADV